MEVIFKTNNGRLIQGDNIEVMKKLKDNSIHSCISDFPYDLSFMGKCYHPDTEVLTIDGWKNIKFIKENDLVYSLNPNTKVIEVTDCIKTYEYNFDGELFEIKGRSIHQIITPNHKVWLSYDKTNYNLIEVQKINKNFYMMNQGKWQGLFADYIIINGETFNIRAFMKFLGLFLGDGCVVNRKKQPEKQDFIVLFAKKERELNAIINCLNELRVNYKQSINKNRTIARSLFA